MKKIFKQFIIIIFASTIINIGSLSLARAQISPSELINLVNSSRSQNNLATLRENAALDQAALAKAQDMFQNQYFNHTSPSGKTPWDFIDAANYTYVYAGENLAIGYSDNQEVHNAWMNSPTHRANILSPNFREIGIAQLSGNFQGEATTIIVQMFGSREFSQPVVNSAATEKNLTVSSSSESGKLSNKWNDFSQIKLTYLDIALIIIAVTAIGGSVYLVRRNFQRSLKNV